MKNNISKKFILTFLLTTIFFIGSNTKAISQFPNTITIRVGNLIPDSFRIFKKEYTGSDGNSGKAFCSSFWNDVYNNTTCSKTYYHSDTSKNEKAQAAVGAIINKYRNSDGSMNWNNYYYAELAINEFLYKKVTYNPVNNLNRYGGFPYYKGKTIQPAVNLGYSVYDSYKSEVVTIDNLKINGVSINENNKDLSENLKNAQNYIITADMKCYKDSTKKVQVACSNPSANLQVQNKEYTVTKSYDGATVKLQSDISTLFKNSSNTAQNITVDLSAESKKTYYLAQRYYCGDEVQTMTPNLLKPSTVSATVSIQGKFSVTPQKGCGDEIKSVTPNDLTYAVDNAELYRVKYRGDSANYGMLLDINNPSCSPTKPSSSSSCDVENGNSVIVNSKQVKYSYFTNKNSISDFGMEMHDYLCTIKFAYNSDTMTQNNISSANKLIYQKNDGIIGRARLIYDCNVPALAKSRNYDVQNYGGLNNNLKGFSLENIAPTLKIKLDNTKEYAMGYRIASVNSNSAECTVNDNNISCKNYNNDTLGYGWSFDADIEYYYPEDFNYSMDKMGVIHKTNSCTDCKEIGYGIYVPNDTEVSSDTVSYTSTVKFEFPGDYEIDNNKLTVSCPYTINKKENNHKDILYRTIDTSNPFASITGKDRLTGSNWCSDSDVDDFDIIDDFGIDNTQIISDENTDITEDKTSKCIYIGDVNQNGEWDNNDFDIIQKYEDKEYSLNNDQLALADINYDGKVDDLDAVAVQKMIRDYANSFKGDLDSNKIIDENDAKRIQAILAEMPATEVEKKLSDMNNDCNLNVQDATALQSIIIGDKNKIKSAGSSVSEYEGDISDDDIYGTLNDVIQINDYDERTKKCVNNNDKVTSIIKNRPNANGDLKIKNEDGTVTNKKAKTPLYRFVLTPENIKNIRTNNKKQKGYTDFNSICDENGEKCVSSFISQLSDNKYVNNVSGLCTPGQYCDITNIIQEKYIKGGA